MEISRIIALGLIGTTFSVLLKKENPQIAMLVAVMTGILTFLMLCTPLGNLLVLLRETAERAAVEFGVEFLYRDFRPYFREGQEKARELGFYMQKYCGCVFSEEERYIKAKKIIP